MQKFLNGSFYMQILMMTAYCVALNVIYSCTLNG